MPRWYAKAAAKRQEDQITSRNKRIGQACFGINLSLDVYTGIGKRVAAQCRKRVDWQNDIWHASESSDLLRTIQFDAVPLTVVKRNTRNTLDSELFDCPVKACGRVLTA